MPTVASLVANLLLDDRQFTSGILNAKTAMEGLAVAALKSALDVQNAQNTIRVATGATGEALGKLSDSFKAVAASVPNSLSQVSEAIAGIAQRSNLTGQALEKLATTELNVSRITDSNLNGVIRDSARAFQEWHIATANQVPTLDLLFRATQQSGIGFNKLEESVVRFAPQLKLLGFNFAQSTALLASFEKGGADGGRVVQGLNLALQKMGREGVQDVQGGLLKVIGAIERAPTPAAALTIAVQAFGRSGAYMAEKIRDGGLEVDKLARKLAGGGDTIAKATDDTLTLSTAFSTLKNQVELALEPFGRLIAQGLQALTTAIGPALTGVRLLGEALQAPLKLTKIGWDENLGGVRTFFTGVKALAAEGFQSIGENFAKGMTELGRLMSLGWGEFRRLWAGAWVSLAKDFPAGWAQFKALWSGAFQAFKDDFAARWNTLPAIVKTVFSKIGEAFVFVFNTLKNFLHDAFPGLYDAFAKGAQVISDHWTAFWKNFGIGAQVLKGNWDAGIEAINKAGAAAQKAQQQAAGGGGTGGPKPPPAPGAGDNWWEKQKQAAKQLADTLDQAREAALRAQAAFRFGELSKEVAAVDLFGKSFSRLSEAHQQAAVKLLGYRQQEEAAKTAMEAAQKAADARREAQEKLTQVVADSRLEFLKAGAVSHFGELSKEAVALDLLSTQWIHLSRAQQQAVLSALDFKQRAKDITEEKAATDALDKSVQDLNLQYLALTGKSPVERFAAKNLGINYGSATDDQKRLAQRAFTQQGNIDTRTGADEAAKSAQSAYVDYLKAQAKATSGENSLQYIALDQFKHSWANLTDAEQAATREILKYNLAASGLTDKGEDKLLDRITAALKTAGEEYEKLRGESHALTVVQELLNAAWASGDDDPLALALALEDLVKANDALKIAMEAAKRATEEQAEAFKNLFKELEGRRQVLKDLDLDYQRLTHGRERDQIALNEYGVLYDRLTAAAKQWVDAQVKGVEKIKQATEKLDFLKKFADGTQQVFQNVFQNLFEHGFKGFFKNVIQGFTQLFQQIAAEYAAKKLTDLIFGKADQQGYRGTQGAGGGGLLGSLGHLAAGLFGGGGGTDTAASEAATVFGRASGGPVNAGQLYRVNEGAGQQEYFLPRTPGTIAPSAAAAGVGGATYHFTYNVTTPNPDAFRRSQAQTLADAHRAAEAARRKGG